MIKFAHVINPVYKVPESDLGRAQPITFETMRIASEYSQREGRASVEFHATIYPEDEAAVPAYILNRWRLRYSVADAGTFREQRKLPLIREILDILYERTSAEYLIYTNSDIALQPHFYETAATLVENGSDAFIINRRTISGSYQSVSELPFMYSELGEPHKGYDCFIFKRAYYPYFILGNICIGTAWIGRTLLANLYCQGSCFREFRSLHATFHIGNAESWRNPRFDDYRFFNQAEYREIYRKLEILHGPFPAEIQSYLLDTGENRFIPAFEECNRRS